MKGDTFQYVDATVPWNATAYAVVKTEQVLSQPFKRSHWLDRVPVQTS